MVSSGLYCPRAGIVSCVLKRFASKNGERMLPWKLTGTASSSSCCLRQTIGLSNSVKSGMSNRQSSCRRGSPRDTWRVWGSVCIRTPATERSTTHMTNDSHQRKVTACFIQYSRSQYKALRTRAVPFPAIGILTQFFVYVTVFTALHGMQTRSSDENSVCPSVCLSNAWIVTKWKKVFFRFLYHTKDHLV